MGASRSPWMVKVYEVLADGAWHDRETLVVAAMPHVPPGKAARQAAYDRARLNTRRRTNGVPEAPASSRPQDAQTVGARTKVGHTIGNAIRRGQLQRRTVAGRIQIRRTPPKDTPT